MDETKLPSPITKGEACRIHGLPNGYRIVCMLDDCPWKGRSVQVKIGSKKYITNVRGCNTGGYGVADDGK
jgi:hypothetical protein